MYHVIGTGLTAILFYLISYFLYRIGYYSIHFHRKLWNTVLAITFLVAVSGGLLMALQVTYKWNIPFIKSILKWHVEFGTGLAFTGIFHLIWHLSYFGKLFNTPGDNSLNPGNRGLPFLKISTNLFVTGFVSSSIQFLLIREMMNISGGYELITGTFLGSWLICSAVGASIAGKSTLDDLKKINLIFTFSPLISLLLMFFLARLFLETGETPSFLVSMVYTFLVLLPFCLVSGFTFVKLISIARSGSNYTPGKSFSLETTGGIVSGIIISILTSGALNTYQLILLIILLSASYVFLTFYLSKPKSKISAKIIISILATCIIILNPDILFRQILLPGLRITSSEDTPYGNITEAKYENETGIYYNQRLLAYSDDVIEREEDIHYAMLQSASPEKVILISGSLNSHLPEILKYDVKKVIYIERDPALANSETFGSEVVQDKLIIANKDAFKYIRNSDELVDVVILLIPPPSTLQLNRYYTTEFFLDVKHRLNSKGIFMCSPGPGDNYMNRESLNLYSSVFNSLTGVFKNVKPVVGNKLYFIASDSDLSLTFCELAEMKNIKNHYVSSDFLSDELLIKKTGETDSLLDHSVRQNSSSFPVACLHFQSYNFSKNQNEKIPAMGLLFLFFAIPAATIKRKNLLMYFSASALAGFEIITLLIFQIVMGNIYQLTGLVIAGLMTGLAVGAGMDLKFLASMKLRTKGIILLLLYITIGFLFKFSFELNSGLPTIFLIISTAFIPALLTGHFFRELTMKTEDKAISSTYSADLAGSAFGFILISGFAVPAFGIQVSLFLLSSLIFAGILFGTIGNK